MYAIEQQRNKAGVRCAIFTSENQRPMRAHALAGEKYRFDAGELQKMVIRGYRPKASWSLNVCLLPLSHLAMVLQYLYLQQPVLLGGLQSCVNIYRAK